MRNEKKLGIRKPCKAIPKSSWLFPNFKRADTRSRTGDLFITNELLYQLSHIGVPIQMWVQRYKYFSIPTNNSHILLRNFTFITI